MPRAFNIQVLINYNRFWQTVKKDFRKYMESALCPLCASIVLNCNLNYFIRIFQIHIS